MGKGWMEILGIAEVSVVSVVSAFRDIRRISILIQRIKF